MAQQHADAVHALVTAEGAGVGAEVLVHVGGDGCSLDDGTPLPEVWSSGSHPGLP